ncbi:hypothetical protein HNS38_00055 [Lentimicrobium sp. L6]|uniref:hypothetical protein n=1 Tax=Lentimicrobium sp. L6 TaxID=2735916 RepID=UPI00155553B2|nr:hypothetical protein [Lentimicrobium sp. L6]NPD83132.1 hypothetical protein [Lentimicrobium sp. L6]
MKNILLAVLIILIFVSILIFTTKKDKRKMSEINTEYTLLENADGLDGDIIDKFDYHAHQLRDPISVSRVSLNGMKIKIIADEVEGRTGLGINEIIEVRDHLLKKEYSDTLVIQKQTGVKYVLLIRSVLYD